MTQRPFNMHVGIYTKTLCDDLRKCLLITLTLLFVCPGVWGQDKNVSQASDFGTVSNSRYTLTNGNTYTLSANISISNYLYIASGSTVTIDLNGQTLIRNLAAAVSNGFIIKNEGTLIIQDSGTGGSIRGGYNNNDGGGVYNNGTLTMTGGTITGNRVASGKNGAGIYNSTTATLNISGKVIVTDNTIPGSTPTPNNVYIPSGKTINITDNLDNDARIGVTLQANYGVFTSGLDTHSGGFNNFSADGTNAEIKMTAVNVEAETIYSYEHIQELINASSDSPTEATVITLNSTKTYDSKSNSSGGTYLHIPSTKKITIDLNGRTIRRSVSDFPEDGYVIKNEGTLTIQNSGGGEGYITGGKNNGNGGGIYNTSTGFLTVTGGRILDNSATGNGGGIYNDGGSVTISGGEIFRCNSSQGNGGGIYNASGTLTITSGKLWQNWVKPTCKGGGIYFESGTFNLSGNPEIYNNSLSNESSGYGSFDKPSNIYLANGQKITITDNLTGGEEKIGITMETPAEFTSGLNGRGTQGKFFVDENKRYNYYHDLTDDDPFVLELSTNETSYEAQLQSYWSKLQTEITNAENSSTITLERNYKAHSSDTHLHIAAGKTITIALNSHTLNRNLSAKRTNGEVIRNDGILTLSGLGYINGGYNEGDGGGIYNNGSLVLDCPSDNCTWISDNYVSEGYQGGGIYNTANASITMSGGIYMCCNYIVSNTNINSNVYLPSGKKITIGDGGIKTNSQIPITHADDRIEFTVGLNWARNSTFPFIADNNTKRVGRTSSGEAIIGPALTLTPSVTGNGSIGITAGQRAIGGEEVTFSVSAETGNVPFSLSYTPEESVATPITCWDNGTYSFTMPNNPTTVSAVFKQGGFCGATDHENEVKYYLADDNETLTFITKNDENVAMYAGYASADDVPWNIEGQKITYSAVSMSDHVTSISPYAFFRSSISSITIPSSVATIGAMALGNCQNLSAIISSSSSFYAESNVLYTAGQTELVCIPLGLHLTSYTLPSTIEEIRDGAFAYNSYLTTINDGGATGFSSSGGVLYKGNVLYCYPARKEGNVYDVASTVTEIKPYAFHNNNLLKVVNFCEASVPTGGKEMFENHNSQLRIMVKKDQGANYKAAPNWINYKDIIFEMDLANAVTSLEYTTHKCTEASLYPDLNGSVTITVDGQTITLRKDKDYTIAKNSDYYANNTAVGTATVTIKGAGGYAGTNKALTFTITRELIISGADNRYTYYASEDLTLPSHLTAWTYTNIDWTTGVMTPTQINYIPANVPVILYRSGASINETLYLTAHAGETHATPIQYYRGTATAKDIDVLKTEINTELHETTEYIYVLRGENFVRATSGTLPAKHCYLYKPSGTAAPSVLTTTFSTISGGSYKIETLYASNGTVNIQYDNSGTPTNVTVNTTEIPAGKTVTLTITPDDGYYLSALQCEEVTTLDVAMAPAHRADKTQEIHKININNNYEGHFAGNYTFPMPRNNVIITATFVACTSIDGGKVYWDSWDGTSALPQSKVYDGAPHTMKVRVGDTELTKDRHYTTTAYTLTNVDNITPYHYGYR